MDEAHGSLRGIPRLVAVALVLGSILLVDSACRGSKVETVDSSSVALRLGVAQMSSTNPTSGIRQLTQNMSVEGLTRVTEDGRLEPVLAESWVAEDGGRSLRMTLKANVKFHDGSPLTPEIVAGVLPDSLRSTFGAVVDDIDRVTAVGANAIKIGFRRPSPLMLEALEAPIRKPGPQMVGTGPFMPSPDKTTTRLLANRNYYLGAPRTGQIQITSFPAVRTAWAELLRNRLDVLYEVGPDALDSLETSRDVAVFTFTRRYQYTLALNTKAPTLRSAVVRRALNMAIDRTKIVANALNGHGVASYGPIWPRHWALPAGLPTVAFDPARAAELLSANRTSGSSPAELHFTCMVPADAVYERIALEIKRQLGAVGIQMDVQSVTQDQIVEAERAKTYEAILIDAVSGPTLLRPYLLWHSKGALNDGGFGNSTIDSAFERVRLAENEASYRETVGALHQAFNEDPPAIFLAWSVRARAVSRRFVVPAAEPGRDILSTLRLWQAVGKQVAARN